MKKLSFLLLCALLAALCVGALAAEVTPAEAFEFVEEALPVGDVEATGEQLSVEPDEAAVEVFEEAPEAEEESEAEEEPEIEAVEVPVSETGFIEDLPAEGGEYVDGSEAAYVQLFGAEPADAFEITNGVLMKYNGEGGEVTIPEGITAIGDEAFAYRTDLTGVVIPEGVTLIGWMAFTNCTALTSISIPDSVKGIDGNAFSYCTALEEVILPKRLSSIGDNVFSSCTSLASVSIPDGVQSIGWAAFRSCTSLERVNLPDSVQSIGWAAFSGCTSLASINIPDGVYRIEMYTFSDCTSLTSIAIPKTVWHIEDNAFSNCTALASVTIQKNPKTDIVIMRDSFGGESERIDYYAFSGCTSLTEITIPNRFSSLGEGAFQGCTNLRSVTLPGSIRYLGRDIFANCVNLHDITFALFETRVSFNVTTYFDFINIDERAFYACPTDITFHTLCDSAATRWAEEKGYTVVKSDHIPQTVSGRAATTTQTGLTDGKRCLICHKVLQAQQEIPKLAPAAPTSSTPSTPSAPAPAPAGPTILSIPAVKKAGKATVNLGSLYRLDLGGATAKSFKSSNKKVATVDGSGLVTLKKAGKAKITVKVGKKKRTVTLKVVDPTAPRKVSLAQGKSVTLKVGESLQLTPAMTPDTAVSTFKWKSSKKKVAAVDGNGLVTAKKKGTAKITVTTKNKKKATIKIKVVK